MRISSVLVIIFSVMLNLYVYEVFFVNRLILDFGNSALYIPMAYFLLSIPIFFIFNCKNKINYFKNIKIFRYLLSIALFGNIIFIAVYVNTIIDEQLFNHKDQILLLVLMLVAVAVLSYNGFETIFHTFILYTPFILVTTIVYFASSLEVKDYGNILPIKFDFGNIYKGFYLLIIPFDILLINFFKPFYKSTFNTASLIIISLIIFLYLSLSVYETISLYPPEMLDATSGSLIARYLAYKGNVLFRNQIIFFLIFYMAICVYKVALYTYTIRILLGMKRKYNSIIPLILGALIHFKFITYMSIPRYFEYLVIITVITISIYTIIPKIRSYYET